MEDVQKFIGYTFRDISLLQKALTAPGADGNKEGTDEERVRYKGNRELSQMGFVFRDLAVHNLKFTKGMPAGKMPYSRCDEISADYE